MKCPKCSADVDDSADRCFNCGHVLRTSTTLVRGSLVAGRYEILALLGKGGMGMVYKARDHTLEETVAVKVLRPELGADKDLEKRFRTEIRLARKVRHRNVCGIYEYNEDGGLRYIAMEYIEGVDLRKVLTQNGPLPLDQAFDTSIHVAEGLQAIHEAGIVHRDLKTANLMRDANGVVRLMDFGIAKQLGEGAAQGATATGMVVGTPEYMSPEQARGEKVDHRSDVYALGIVTFELFTGRLPFRGETPIATIFKHLQEPPPLEGPDAPPLPAPLIPVLRRALAKTPDERYSSAAELAAALAQARDEAGVPRIVAEPLTPKPSSTAPTVATPRTVLAPGAAAPATRVTPAPAPTVVARPETRRTPRPGPPPAPPQPVRAFPTGLVAAVGIVGLVVVVGALLLLRGRMGLGPSPAPTPALSPAPASPGTAETEGTLIIDALPWGEVVSVTDGHGARHEPPSSRFTPLSLALPPGDYTIQVRNSAFAGPLSATVTVRAAQTERRLVEFRRVDAADYFKRTGL